MGTETSEYYVTAEAYLANEERAKIRHEYVDGIVYAMTGATRRHNIICLNIAVALRSHLKSNPCQAYVNDVKAYIQATNSYYYPDVMVSCDKSSMTSVLADAPILIVEVISRSTMSTDRREKLYAYRQLPSLREYMIVHQARRRVELHRRTADGNWKLSQHGPNGVIVLESLPTGPLRISIDEIYEQAGLGPEPPFEVREGSDDAWSYESYGDAEEEDDGDW